MSGDSFAQFMSDEEVEVEQEDPEEADNHVQEPEEDPTTPAAQTVRNDDNIREQEDGSTGQAVPQGQSLRQPLPVGRVLPQDRASCSSPSAAPSDQAGQAQVGPPTWATWEAEVRRQTPLMGEREAAALRRLEPLQ